MSEHNTHTLSLTHTQRDTERHRDTRAHRDTQAHRHTRHAQTDRTDRQTDRQTDRKTDIQATTSKKMRRNNICFRYHPHIPGDSLETKPDGSTFAVTPAHPCVIAGVNVAAGSSPMRTPVAKA